MRAELDLIGALFEAELMSVLKQTFDCYIVHDKVFKCRYLKRGVTQVDIIVITDRVIFCIEAKRWRKFLKGGINDDEWIAMSDRMKPLFVFNPVLQNMNHIRMIKSSAIKHNFKLPPIINLICVPDSCVIMTDSKSVMRVTDMIVFIERVLNSMKCDIIDKESVFSFINSI